MRLNYTFIGVLFLALLASCEKEAKVVTTEAGLTYTLVVEGDGAPVTDGSVVEFTADAKVFTDGEEVQRRVGAPPFNEKIVFAQAKENPLMSILMERKIGDSLTVVMPLNEKTKPYMPPTAKETTEVHYYMKVNRVETEEENMARRQKEYEEQQAEMQRKMEEQKPIDDGLIQSYIQENGLTTEKTESGLYYTITESKGNAKPSVGDNVQVHYTGTLLDGTQFDSSVGKGQPFSFPLGQGRVIRGWDEGIALLGKGDKAVLLIPSHLGYGPRAAGEKIPASSVLKFEVELIDFESPKK